MTFRDYRFKENSKIFLRRNEQEKVEIYIEISKENRVIEKVSTIPNPFLDFIEEIPLKNYDSTNLAKIIYSYFDKNTKEYILEMVECNFHDKLFCTKKRWISKIRVSRICPGTYCYRNPKGELTLIKDNHQTFKPEKISAYYKYEDRQLVTKVTFPQDAISIDENYYLEMCLHFEPEEVLHTILKISSAPYKEFQISNKVWSEMTNQEYLLWDEGQDKEYTNYNYFSAKFETSSLAKEIVYINHLRQDQNQKTEQNISNKILKRIQSKQK